ncbi:MAG TPA: tetratricopeptide repeat protein [Parachlamydiaceae bacterium]|nr:tetratricopeptide repeat protein [Parachlamydiaceae bacterium]
MDQIQPFYLPLSMPEMEPLEITGTDILTKEIKKQWKNNRPFILALYHEEVNSSHEFSYCSVFNLKELCVNPNITKTFFFVLHLSKKSTVSNHYIGSSRNSDERKTSFLNFILKAACGYDSSIYELGKAFVTGENVIQNYKLAKRLLKISVEDHQNKKACFYLGYIYKNSPHSKDYFNKTLKWLSKAVDNKDLRAFYEMGLLYYNNPDLPNAVEKSFLWFLKAAENNCERSQVMLSKVYKNGIGRKQDLEKAYYWLVFAAINENNEAEIYIQNKLDNDSDKSLIANAYYEVLLTFENHTRLVFEYEKKKTLREKAAKLGHLEAQLLVGEHLYKNGSYQESRYWFKKAKEQGSQIGAFFYLQPEDIPYSKAVFLLGHNLKKGKNIIKNEENAIKYLKKAAKLGSTEAHYELGLYYCSTFDIKKYDLGLKYLEVAAKENYKDAASIIACHMPD